MKKLRLPSLVVLVRGMNRSPRSAERRPGRPVIVSDCADNTAEVGRSGALDTVKSQCSNFELYPLSHWQPVEDVAKNWCDVLIFTKTDNETSGSVEYHL